MDRMIDEYIKEMQADIAPNEAVAAMASTDSAAEDGGEYMGGLLVAATTLRGTRPVPGAVVEVFEGEINNRTTVHRETADESGRTKVIPLKTKSRDLSEAPGQLLPPFITYNVSVTADGFAEQINMGVPIFEGVVSIQNVDMTSLGALDGKIGPIINDAPSGYNL